MDTQRRSQLVESNSLTAKAEALIRALAQQILLDVSTQFREGLVTQVALLTIENETLRNENEDLRQHANQGNKKQKKG